MKTSRRSANMKRRRISFHPVSEQLEQRRVLSTFQVTTTNDSVAVNAMTGAVDPTGQVSLRSAIMAADANPGNNTINLPAGDYALTLSGMDGDLEINGGLTIQGAGASSSIINGEGLGRVFEIDGGTVTISGVTVTGGKASMGGGILNNGGNLTLSGDMITGNRAVGFTGANGVAGTSDPPATGGAGAEGGAALGGGVDNASGTLSIVNSTISSNTATGGTGGVGGAGGASHGAPGSAATSANAMGGPGGPAMGASGQDGGLGGPGLGGGVYNALGAQLTLASTTFSENAAVGGTGGAGGVGGKGVGGPGGASDQTPGGILSGPPTDIGGTGGAGTGGTGGPGGQGGIAQGGGLYNGGTVTVTDTNVAFMSNTATGGVGGEGGTGGTGAGGVGGPTQQNQMGLSNFMDVGGTGGAGVGGVGGAGGTGGQAEGGGLYNAPGVQVGRPIGADLLHLGGGGGLQSATAAQLTAPALNVSNNKATGGMGGEGGTGGTAIGGQGADAVNAVSGNGGASTGGLAGAGGAGGNGQGGGAYNDTGATLLITAPSGNSSPALSSFGENMAIGGNGGAGGTGGRTVIGDPGTVPGEDTPLQQGMFGSVGSDTGGSGGVGGQGGTALGGALYNLGSASVTGVSVNFDGNVAQGGTGGTGGNGFVPTDPFNVFAGQDGIGGNGGSAHGGGIDNDVTGSLTLAPEPGAANSDFIKMNSAVAGSAGMPSNGGGSSTSPTGGTAFGGGATFSTNGTATLSNTTIENNNATSGDPDKEGSFTPGQVASPTPTPAPTPTPSPTPTPTPPPPPPPGGGGSGGHRLPQVVIATPALTPTPTPTPTPTLSPTPTPTPTPTLTPTAPSTPTATTTPTPTTAPTPAPAPTPPDVTGIAPAASSSKGLTAISVTFDEALDAVAASNTALFQVLGGVSKHHKNVFTRAVTIKATAYNPATHTVTLNLAKPFKGPVQVTVEPGLKGSDGASSSSATTNVVG